MPNWQQVLGEIRDEETKAARRAVSAVDKVRLRYLSQLSKHTGRNTIAYYSGWLSNPTAHGVDVNDDDKNGFMMAIHGLDTSLGVDVILHTPGGGIAAAESLVDYLQRMFGTNIRAIVPQIALSAGTMIACACQSIVMGKHSNLGPIDPQLHGLPAAEVKKEFDRALSEIKADPAMIQVWQFILQKYNPTFLAQCEQAVKWSEQFVLKHLKSTMFDGDANADSKADAIVKALSDVKTNMTHVRHIHIDECEAIGLKIERLENDQKLQNLVLTTHHCFIHSLELTGAAKIIENQQGRTFIKVAA